MLWFTLRITPTPVYHALDNVGVSLSDDQSWNRRQRQGLFRANVSDGGGAAGQSVDVHQSDWNNRG